MVAFAILITTVSAQSIEIYDKTLLNVENQPEVYWFQNGKLYWVTDWNVIDQMSEVPGWENVKSLPSTEFNSTDYPQNSRFINTGIMSNGLLIRQVDDYKVYLIENGMKRHITYIDVMSLKSYSMDDVIIVAPSILTMFPLGDPIGIEVDLYFNKITDSREISHISQFKNGEIIKFTTETTVTEDYNVETYVYVTSPDGIGQYAYYENVDFLQTDSLKFSNIEIPLYPATWHALTKTWNWNEYTFTGTEKQGVYNWEFWYKDIESGKILGKDVQGYEFIKSTELENVPKPDLIITDISFEKDNPSEGEPIEITATIKNIGNAEARGNIVIIFSQVSDINNDGNNKSIIDYNGNHERVSEFGFNEFKVYDYTISMPTNVINSYNNHGEIERLLNPGESKKFSVSWNAAPVYDADQNGFIHVHVDALNEIDEIDENNNEMFGKVAITSRSDFRPEIDGYQFPNHASESATGGALCYGMSATSILYYTGGLTKPVNKDTFSLLKSDNGVESNTIKYQNKQKLRLGYIGDNLKRFASDFSYHPDLKKDYKKICESINKGEPIISTILWRESSGFALQSQHSVVAYNTYEVSDSLKNVIVYDPNYPGMARVIQFDFESNKIRYEHYNYSKNYHITSEYLLTNSAPVRISDNVNFQKIKDWWGIS